MQVRKVLMTGGDGFVGGWLGPMISSIYPNAEHLTISRGTGRALAGWTRAQADLLDRVAIEDIVKTFQPDLVIHMAAQSSVGSSYHTGYDTWNVNFNATSILASACGKFAESALFFFTSSSEVYGKAFVEGPVDELARLMPQNAYGRSKAAAEQMLPDVLSPDNRLIIARSFNHTGPGQDIRFVVPSFANQIARMEMSLQPPSMMVGNLEASRDLMDVRDVCGAYLSLIRVSKELERKSTFNVASGKSYIIADILRKLRSLTSVNFEARLDPNKMRPSDIPISRGVSTKLISATGWSPSYSINRTLEDVLQFYRDKYS